MRAITDYTKKKTGKLIGVRIIGRTDCEVKRVIWLMVCECGNEVVKTAAQIRSKKLMSCMDCKVQTLKRPKQSKFYNGYKRKYTKKGAVND